MLMTLCTIFIKSIRGIIMKLDRLYYPGRVSSRVYIGYQELEKNAVLLEQLCILYGKCFNEKCEPNNFIDSVIGFHSPEQCIWIILTDGKDSPIGMLTCIPYSDSVFVFNLSVIPERQHRGYGTALLLEACSFILAHRLPPRISGSVPSAHTHLQSFYNYLGATTRVLGITNSEVQVKSIRFERNIDDSLIPILHRTQHKLTGPSILPAVLVAAIIAGSVVYFIRSRNRRR